MQLLLDFKKKMDHFQEMSGEKLIQDFLIVQYVDCLFWVVLMQLMQKKQQNLFLHAEILMVDLDVYLEPKLMEDKVCLFFFLFLFFKESLQKLFSCFLVFCCVGALAILGQLDKLDADLLGWWLCERQLPIGGLNGRPEKLPDVCYSWWIVSALAILDRLHWISAEKLISFILACQDDENGGIADRPGDVADVFHTFFGVAGLSLMGFPNLAPIDPAFAMPVSILNRMKLTWKK